MGRRIYTNVKTNLKLPARLILRVLLTILDSATFNCNRKSEKKPHRNPEFKELTLPSLRAEQTVIFFVCQHFPANSNFLESFPDELRHGIVRALLISTWLRHLWNIFKSNPPRPLFTMRSLDVHINISDRYPNSNIFIGDTGTYACSHLGPHQNKITHFCGRFHSTCQLNFGVSSSIYWWRKKDSLVLPDVFNHI